jgi:hypothetical protein
MTAGRGIMHEEMPQVRPGGSQVFSYGSIYRKTQDDPPSLSGCSVKPDPGSQE